jgi:hypothetical protein
MYTWEHCLQRFERLADDLGCYGRRAGHVSAWMSEAMHQTGSDWISDVHHHNRYVAGRFLYRNGCLGDKSHDYIHWNAHEFARERWKVLIMIVRRPDF